MPEKPEWIAQLEKDIEERAKAIEKHKDDLRWLADKFAKLDGVAVLVREDRIVLVANDGLIVVRPSKPGLFDVEVAPYATVEVDGKRVYIAVRTFDSLKFERSEAFLEKVLEYGNVAKKLVGALAEKFKVETETINGGD